MTSRPIWYAGRNPRHDTAPPFRLMQPPAVASRRGASCRGSHGRRERPPRPAGNRFAPRSRATPAGPSLPAVRRKRRVRVHGGYNRAAILPGTPRRQCSSVHAIAVGMAQLPRPPRPRRVRFAPGDLRHLRPAGGLCDLAQGTAGTVRLAATEPAPPESGTHHAVARWLDVGALKRDEHRPEAGPFERDAGQPIRSPGPASKGRDVLPSHARRARRLHRVAARERGAFGRRMAFPLRLPGDERLGLDGPRETPDHRSDPGPEHGDRPPATRCRQLLGAPALDRRCARRSAR